MNILPTEKHILHIHALLECGWIEMESSQFEIWYHPFRSSLSFVFQRSSYRQICKLISLIQYETWKFVIETSMYIRTRNTITHRQLYFFGFDSCKPIHNIGPIVLLRYQTTKMKHWFVQQVNNKGLTGNWNILPSSCVCGIINVNFT